MLKPSGWLARVALVGLAVAPASCSMNPATGRSEFSYLSRQDEISLGSEAYPQLLSESGGKVPSAEAQAYVTRIGMALAAKTEGDNPSLPWEFTLVEDRNVNAYALPGGKIGFTRGLAERLQSEAEMAAVLGHEVGHVTARHANSNMVRQGLTTLVVGAAAVGVGAATDDNDTAQAVATGGMLVGSVVLLSYSRDQESEADSLGMRYMVACGYDPTGAARVMQVLAEASGGGRGGAFESFLSTHPDPALRYERVTKEIASRYGFTQNNAQYQRFEDRYRTQFLAKLPPARGKPSAGNYPPPGRLRGDGATPSGRRFALGVPATWCAHCASADVR